MGEPDDKFIIIYYYINSLLVYGYIPKPLQNSKNKGLSVSVKRLKLPIVK